MRSAKASPSAIINYSLFYRALTTYAALPRSLYTDSYTIKSRIASTVQSSVAPF